jgi:hypothetical protein
LRNAAADAADVVGAGASSAGSAIGEVAAGLAGKAGSLRKRQQDGDAASNDVDSETADERSEVPDA